MPSDNITRQASVAMQDKTPAPVYAAQAARPYPRGTGGGGMPIAAHAAPALPVRAGGAA